MHSETSWICKQLFSLHNYHDLKADYNFVFEEVDAWDH